MAPQELRPTPKSLPFLHELVEDIVTAIRPEKIILFGSRARGTAEPDSDIDLFLQIETGRDIRQATRDTYRVLHQCRHRPPVPIDVVVKDTSFVERYGDLVGTILRPVLQEGRVLYAR